MDTRRTKRSVKEIVKVDPEPVAYVNQSSKNLSPELWTMIFNMFKDSHEDRKVGNTELAKLRGVCAHWRNVIDENLFFEPAIGDKVVIRRFNRRKALKVKKCSVAWLNTPPKPKKIQNIVNPTLIKEVSFGEGVSTDAFLAMCEHFNKMCNVTSVGISHGLEFCASELIATNSDDADILSKFWGKVKKLDLNVPSLNLSIRRLGGDRSLVGILRKAEMPQLKSVKITGPWKLLISPFPIIFLSRNNSSLECFHLVLEPNSAPLAPQLVLSPPETFAWFERLLWKIPKGNKIAEIEKIQVESIIIEGSTLCLLTHIIRSTWMPLILRQKKLIQLELRHICQTSPVNKDVKNPLLFDEFIPVLKNNMSTLTHLELFELQFNEKVDFKLFQGLNKLETLKLSKNSDELLSSIVNMNCLPGSLKKLSICGIGCSDMQLKQFAEAAHFKNLSRLQLVCINDLSCAEDKGNVEEICADLIGMKSIIFVHLSGFAVRRTKEGDSMQLVDRKYFEVSGGKGPLLHVNDS